MKKLTLGDDAVCPRMRPPTFGCAFLSSLILPLLVGCVGLPVDDQLILSRAETAFRVRDAVCGHGWFESGGGSPGAGGLDPRGFSLMSWNVFKAQGESWAAEFARLSAGKQLVLLQEAHLTTPFRDAMSRSGLQWYMAHAFDYRGAETGVLIASRVSPSAVCVGRAAEPVIRVPKSMLLARYQLNGAGLELWVANLHGVNFTLGVDRFRRQLESLAEVLDGHDGPLILAGDLNDWNQERSQVLAAIAARLGLTPLTLEDDVRSRHMGSPVDHVFVRDLAVVEANSVVVSGSDHNPITARLRFTGNLPK